MGKLAKFAILSQNARETGHTFHVVATTGKSNTAYTPGCIDSNESPQTMYFIGHLIVPFLQNFLQELVNEWLMQVGLAVRQHR